MRVIFFVLVVLALMGGALYFGIGRSLLPARPTEPELVEVSREAAASAEEKLSRLASQRQAISLTDVELTSLLHYRPEIWSLGGVVSPVVDMEADSVRIRGAFATDRLPVDPSLDAIRSFLPDTAEVNLAGTVRTVDEVTVALHIAAVEVAGMPIPPRYVPMLLDRLGLPVRDDIPADAFALPLPPGIRSASIEDGVLTLNP